MSRPFDPSAKLRTGRARDMLQGRTSSVMLVRGPSQVLTRINLNFRFRGKDEKR